MDSFSITYLGIPVDESLYYIDIANKVFVSEEHGLVLDFTDRHDWLFYTGRRCTFKTGDDCTFKTGNFCTFKTGSDCVFQTYNNSTFDTGSFCTFDAGDNCKFKTANWCMFHVNECCTFDTGTTCSFLLRDISTHKFKKHDGVSTILDRKDEKHYLLTKEFVQLQKVKHG